MKNKWKRISIALTEKELDMLRVVKNYYGINNREILTETITVIWEEIPKKYKKEYEKKWGKQNKKIKKTLRQKKKGLQ